VPFSTLFFWGLVAKASGFNPRFSTPNTFTVLSTVQVMGDVDAGLQVALGCEFEFALQQNCRLHLFVEWKVKEMRPEWHTFHFPAEKSCLIFGQCLCVCQLGKISFSYQKVSRCSVTVWELRESEMRKNVTAGADCIETDVTALPFANWTN